MHMVHATLRHVYVTGLVDVKTLLNATDIQVEQPIKLLRRKMNLLTTLLGGYDAALVAGFESSDEFRVLSTDGEIEESDYMGAYGKYIQGGMDKGDSVFRNTVRSAELIDHVLLFHEQSKHGLWAVPELIEHQFIGIFDGEKKHNYADALARSRLMIYSRSSELNEKMRRGRTIR